MALGIDEIKTILTEHGLIQEIVSGEDVSFDEVTYDSRNVKPNTLFFCKGNFKPEYLAMAKKMGATGYVAEQKYDEGNGLTQIIVNNVQKAMSLVGAAFYCYPQNDLFVIAYTGTKGKTTSSYFAKSILDNTNDNKTALISTIDTVVGNEPSQRFKSHLTTPESLDIFNYMRQAVDNGMTSLVMEVSSQAYKKLRVYGLHFDVGIFLNISPDHIGPNEHPTFADYLHCKEQLMVNSTHCIINADTDYMLDVYEAAKATTEPDKIYLFSRDKKKFKDVQIDFNFSSISDTIDSNEIRVVANSEKAKKMNVEDDYKIGVVGDYNEANAMSAIIAAALDNASASDAKKGLKDVFVPGRMESYKSKNNGTIYVDYAHNYASMHALLGFLKSNNPDGKVIVVVGSPGNKGLDRREGFGKALTESADIAFLTSDDPAFEDPKDIINEIDSYINHDKVDVHIELDRKMAIKKAIHAGDNNAMIVVAGKGRDPYQKINGVDTPYETDPVVVQNVLRGIDNE
ncbi:UDP-N-acetylmuramoyl-L-alanyl-D-glutamate--2,6-diaminopimelate ligase [Lactobacillus kunkeei]|uniref:UDP-N-acetylmuramoyl-L-alanyl-D-glutamate--L-lysine ligase n=1 Tax=Apilactobacillus nanyangensis TaxID=2799579 RepID=A0ABT0HYR2_9LACO|nr:UDP-N-acetylmuramoyl-L-alanyl-D-glutamate--2,6-diaminopimelate ligase [Apilactobacillus nanyangensis]MBC6388226.1 UDP-N-acetylmuramoyl-L-alanyl-D-glutamate--2,6-diaminopimelate ligase [Apilactobacillus kunkeei]MCK8612064.1 UDP-N-acetylmuramoyl-L-alanyl-D-glutamate--2,6-diaminopimelate ligase [Apilactobacillus nanyangensis]TMT02838.1 UDP-N-acetylmuramoyl-L-alanyl-D-glutamate--2,6-diaminopimelate ligase [Apilactobacillus kunkeei]TMT04334.1 UDP-N-acetylmuramoyl-L-alanyl-D-glutamate--2,6-diamino